MKHVNTREHYLTYGAGALLGSAIATLNVVTNAPPWTTPLVLFVACIYYTIRAIICAPLMENEPQVSPILRAADGIVADNVTENEDLIARLKK